MDAVAEAIAEADSLLPGSRATGDGPDARWQAIIRVGAFINSHPEPVWAFAVRWGMSDDEDLRMAIATVILEHLLEAHFDSIFPRALVLAAASPRFSETFTSCWLSADVLGPERVRQFEEAKEGFGTPAG